MMLDRHSDRSSSRRPSGRLALGLAMIAAGALLCLEPLHLVREGFWELHWPWLLVGGGALVLAFRGFSRSFLGHLMMALGLVAAADQYGREDLLHTWWPLWLVWLGLWYVASALRRSRLSAPPPEAPSHPEASR